MSIQLDESFFYNHFAVDMKDFYISDYTDIINEIETINKEDYDDVDEYLEDFKGNITNLENILQRVNVQYKLINVAIKINMTHCFNSNPYYMDGVEQFYLEGIFFELEELLNKDDIHSFSDEINNYSGYFSKVKFCDLKPLTKKILQKLEIYNGIDIRWDKEFKGYVDMYIKTTLDSFEFLHNKVVDDLNKIIKDSKESLKNIYDIFVF